MNPVTKKAILAVSFGTSHPDTCEKTIGRIEDTFREQFPKRHIYRAFTSGIILEKRCTRDGIRTDSVSSAMERMLCDGITDVIVQPTLILNGTENDCMKEEALRFRDSFSRFALGAPLLTSQEDLREVLDILHREWQDLPSDEAQVFLGHGSDHCANSVYAALDRMLEETGSNRFLGTVEASPSFCDVFRKVSALSPARVHLIPFLIVAGEHARHDLAGEEPSSWKSRFENAGYPVTCHLRGLGEYEGIRRIFVRHVRDCIPPS